MLKILFRLLAVIGLLIGSLILIGNFLPRGYSIDAQIEIAAPPAEVFPMVNVISNWQHWSTWNSETIPDLTVEYDGKEAGVGAIQRWTDSRGSGVLEITASQPDSTLEYKMQFMEFPEMISDFHFEPTEAGTRISWKSDGELPSGAFYGYWGLLFEGQMEYEYARSLDRMKAFVEKND